MKYFKGILKLYLVSNKVSYMILVAFFPTVNTSCFAKYSASFFFFTFKKKRSYSYYYDKASSAPGEYIIPCVVPKVNSNLITRVRSYNDMDQLIKNRELHP